MAKRNEECYSLAQEWLVWKYWRRLYGDPPRRGILAKLVKDEPRPSSGEPDAEINAELAAFHLAVMDLSEEMQLPFAAMYCGYRPKPIKTMAGELGISRDTFYERAHYTATLVMATTRKLVEFHRQMREELLF